MQGVKLVFITIVTLLIPMIAQAVNGEICSRTATINFQEVLVDTSADRKGEGLRFYLEKDEMAKRYLDEYQEKGRPRWFNAAIGTSGIGLILFGVINPDKNSSGIIGPQGLIFSGVALIAMNFLLAEAMEKQNEELLDRAVEEYNKRNLPRIYFSPFKKDNDIPYRGGPPSSSNRHSPWGANLYLVQRF